MTTTEWDNRPAARVGVEEDRACEQFTAQILRHRPGKPGHVYTAQVLAHVRANSLDDLWREVAAFTGDDRRLSDDD